MELAKKVGNVGKELGHYDLVFFAIIVLGSFLGGSPDAKCRLRLSLSTGVLYLFYFDFCCNFPNRIIIL